MKGAPAMSESRMVVIQKNATEQLRIEAMRYEGREMIDFRVWYLAEGDPTDPVYKPTRKGVTFKREMLPEVIEALEKALHEETETR